MIRILVLSIGDSMNAAACAGSSDIALQIFRVRSGLITKLNLAQVPQKVAR